MVLSTNQFLAIEDSGTTENEISETEEIENQESESIEADVEQSSSGDFVSVPIESDPGVHLSIISDQLNDMMDKLEPTNTVTEIETPSGPIAVVHTITLGDLIISTVLMALLIFTVINQLIRRF